MVCISSGHEYGVLRSAWSIISGHECGDVESSLVYYSSSGHECRMLRAVGSVIGSGHQCEMLRAVWCVLAVAMNMGS